MAVEHGDDRGVGGEPGEQPLDRGGAGGIARYPGLAGAEPVLVEAVGRGDGQQPDIGNILAQRIDRRLGLGGHRPHIGHRERRAVAGRSGPPVGAPDRAGAPVLLPAPGGLRNGAGRQPERHRAAVVRLHVAEPPGHDLGELVDEGGLEGREPGLAERDQRSLLRLVRPALGRERDAGRRCRQHEPRVLVAGVVQRIEAAPDERVVERADGQEPLAEDRPGEPEGGQRQEQVVLRDAELDMLAAGRHDPALRRQHVLLGIGVGGLVAAEDAAPVDPRPEIGRDRDVGRGGDDAVGELTPSPRDVAQDPAEPVLGRDRRPVRRVDPFGHRDPRRRVPPRIGGGERHPGEERLQLVFRDV